MAHGPALNRRCQQPIKCRTYALPSTSLLVHSKPASISKPIPCLLASIACSRRSHQLHTREPQRLQTIWHGSQYARLIARNPFSAAYGSSSHTRTSNTRASPGPGMNDPMNDPLRPPASPPPEQRQIRVSKEPTSSLIYEIQFV